MHDSETLTAGAPVWKENSLRNANTTQNQVSATAANSPRRLTGGRTPRRRPRGHSPVHPALQVVSRLVSAQSIFKATVPEALQEPLFEVLALAWNGKGGVFSPPWKRDAPARSPAPPSQERVPRGPPTPLTEVVQREAALVRGPRLEALGPEVHGGRHTGSPGAAERRTQGSLPSTERVERPLPQAPPLAARALSLGAQAAQTQRVGYRATLTASRVRTVTRGPAPSPGTYSSSPLGAGPPTSLLHSSRNGPPPPTPTAELVPPLPNSPLTGTCPATTRSSQFACICNICSS